MSFHLLLYCTNNFIELNFGPLLEGPSSPSRFSPYSACQFRISAVSSIEGHTSHDCLCTLPTCVICLPILKYSFTLIVNGSGPAMVSVSISAWAPNAATASKSPSIYLSFACSLCISIYLYLLSVHPHVITWSLLSCQQNITKIVTSGGKKLGKNFPSFFFY